MTQRLHDTIRRLEAERDALAAQVAALVDRFSAPGHDMENEGLLAQAEAAAAKYLAAQRACEIIWDQSQGTAQGSYMEDESLNALDEWRKAGEA